MNIYVGTSGFQYAHWNNGVFYPPRTKDRLAYAYSKMNVLEINSTFYSIPKPEMVAGWAEKIPAGAKMILKAPQSVTHRRRLRLQSAPHVKPGEHLLHYFADGCLRIPEEKRGPVLVQLPNRMAIDLQRLEAVLQLLTQRSLKVALEVRHASWCVTPTFELLAKYRAALVASDWHEFATPLVPTADFIYLRRHGPDSVYSSLYSEEAVAEDIALIRRQQVDEAYELFNNDVHGYAPQNVMQMLRLLRQE
ncbi:uncharacterized protein YecE (DUF72 family) [Paucimonas lemoignei]|uniref:Uncharacterized protein YecE (DUF72 family) n=1 Tax=Paucimonas lemoignei TaxID=29443 RepID=A0A4V2UI74_PAULE|nr:DUF72 domain-containing protein [Paucimonas lemoignei]TCS33738.1 uncharacterized protein YecE (DUF72 family) [Paucimonas lemoignei]